MDAPFHEVLLIAIALSRSAIQYWERWHEAQDRETPALCRAGKLGHREQKGQDFPVSNLPDAITAEASKMAQNLTTQTRGKRSIAYPEIKEHVDWDDLHEANQSKAPWVTCELIQCQPMPTISMVLAIPRRPRSQITDKCVRQKTIQSVVPLVEQTSAISPYWGSSTSPKSLQ